MLATERAEAKRRWEQMMSDPFFGRMLAMYLPEKAVVTLVTASTRIRDLTCQVHVDRSGCVAVLEPGNNELTVLLCSVDVKDDKPDGGATVRIRFWLPGQQECPTVGELTEHNTVGELLAWLRLSPA